MHPLSSKSSSKEIDEIFVSLKLLIALYQIELDFVKKWYAPSVDLAISHLNKVTTTGEGAALFKNPTNRRLEDLCQTLSLVGLSLHYHCPNGSHT